MFPGPSLLGPAWWCIAMKPVDLLRKVESILASAGFYVIVPTVGSHLFDIVARKDQQLVLIKVVHNIEALKKPAVHGLIQLAKHLGASPMVVGVRYQSGEMSPGVIYRRYGAPVISVDTLEEILLHGLPPLVLAAPGGAFVRLDGEKLRRIRAERRLSLGQIADAAGVSRKAIQMYEKGKCAMVEVAVRLEEFLGTPVVVPLDPFTYSEDVRIEEDRVTPGSRFEREVYYSLTRVGFKVHPTRRCPFDAICKEDQKVLLSDVEAGRVSMKRLSVLSSIGKVAEKPSVLFIKKEITRENIKGVPVVMKKDLEKISDPSDLMLLIRERKG